MNVDWAALGQVFGVSLAVTVGFVALFTFGILGTSGGGRRPGGSGADPVAADGQQTLSARAGAYACFGLCFAMVAYGIHLIVA
ncbi:hypothetical protein [Streptomyces sp. TP-A0874]|uniref:hypothetical protein n=1 Tax=Streptomyces sp. TP-A0874 TaxID=549819 RepID=UPI000853D56F|nr:hypothetical protein [Streptomyces sp. TP-A0874]